MSKPSSSNDYVLVRLKRPGGYEDVHPELILQDADINPAFEPELVTAVQRRELMGLYGTAIEANDAKDAAPAGPAEQHMNQQPTCIDCGRTVHDGADTALILLGGAWKCEGACPCHECGKPLALETGHPASQDDPGQEPRLFCESCGRLRLPRHTAAARCARAGGVLNQGGHIVIETRTYSDGTTATGPAPLPMQSPAESLCPHCGSEEWDRITDRNAPGASFNRCSRCEREWGPADIEDIRANLKEAIARGRDPHLSAEQCVALVQLIDAAGVEASGNDQQEKELGACSISRATNGARTHDRRTEERHQRSGEEKPSSGEAWRCDATRPGGAELGARGSDVAQHEVRGEPGPSTPATAGVDVPGEGKR